MEFFEYDNKVLIEFYIKNGLEFDNTRGYFGDAVKSFVILKDNKVIGAVSISKYKNKNFIEALAVDNKYRNKGIGKRLLYKAIKELSTPVYTISKLDEFYLKNGFVYDDADLIDKECKTCEEYNITCFPRVVVYK